MDREEKVLDTAIDALISRCQDLKTSIASFILKLEVEGENVKWPSVLDSFALISGQISNLMKVLRNEKTPSLRNRVLLPLTLCPDRDEELAKLTDNRVQAFNHEMVPDYLRTKPEPEVEAKDQQLILRATQITPDAGQKQITSINKIVNNILEIVKSAKEDWESDSLQKASAAQSSNIGDTHTLIAAVSLGKGLKDVVSPKPAIANAAQQPPQIPTAQVPRSGPGKAPSAIKTNIKSASSTIPYSR
ncbi:mediator of RNA polymerase II transcription subunit 8-B-like protein [Leptotrombidium deliense]|uniref:Mediator of RNA polymerase II transcription subunit 8 n=1 Tax=Leptotrombidium deliense TaxID=299467 RepID=A0A443RZV3_9ACAR|nr:mediator of RNA polymerase II transcription subunit 8-B-like protein [Leptotrombidium deliense]